MTSVAIMQPTYLPWSGYFNLMAFSDVFVVLDDAQFQRSSWHCRNQIILGGDKSYLTVPIKRTGLQSRIDEVVIDYSKDWRKSHEGMIKQAYTRTKGGSVVIEALVSAWNTRPERLIDLNIMIIMSMAKILNIGSTILRSSQLGVIGKRSDRLLQICHRLCASDYLSPAGAAQYLKDDGFCNQKTVALHLQNFVPHAYPQPKAEIFVPYMSVVDVIANLGPHSAAQYVRQACFNNSCS